MSTPSIQTLITQAQQVLNLKSSNEIRATLAAILANANVGTPLNPNLTTQQLWDEFYEIVRQPSDDIMSIITDQMMRMVFSPPAPGGAGADKQVIFNDGGVLAGDSKFLWDKTANRLDVDGPVVVNGQLSTANVLKATGNPSLNFASATEAFVAHNTGYGAVLYGQGTTCDAALLDRNTGLRLTVTTSGAQVSGDLSITSGNVVMATSGKGIDFGVTTPDGTGTVTSELLNDYEEGTFSPTVIGGTIAGVGVYGTAVGLYTKVGSLVTVQVYLDWTAHTGTGDMRFGNFPFTTSSSAGALTAAAIGYVQNIALTASNILTGWAGTSATSIFAYQTPVGGGASTAVPIDTSGTIIFNITYRV
jgi:hypothetical protein